MAALSQAAQLAAYSTDSRQAEASQHGHSRRACAQFYFVLTLSVKPMRGQALEALALKLCKLLGALLHTLLQKGQICKAMSCTQTTALRGLLWA